MKLIISSAFFAALLTSASANPCESAGNNAAVDILYANGCQYRSVPSDNTSSGCGDKVRAARACKNWIGQYISQGWCDDVSYNVRRLKEQCQDKVLENEETGSEEEVVFSEDSGDNEDEDATVLAANTYLRSNCGRYESAGPAVMKADQIVVDLWRRSGERCGYANSVFPEQAKAALRKEFPDNCWENENAFNANKLARQHGERKINEIVSSCSRPVPRPSGPPREPTHGSRRYRSCFNRCMRNGNRRRRCENRCLMDEENVIDLFYDTGGFAIMPTDEEFEEYLGESMDGGYEEEE